LASFSLGVFILAMQRKLRFSKQQTKQ